MERCRCPDPTAFCAKEMYVTVTANRKQGRFWKGLFSTFRTQSVEELHCQADYVSLLITHTVKDYFVSRGAAYRLTHTDAIRASTGSDTTSAGSSTKSRNEQLRAARERQQEFANKKAREAAVERKRKAEADRTRKNRIVADQAKIDLAGGRTIGEATSTEAVNNMGYNTVQPWTGSTGGYRYVLNIWLFDRLKSSSSHLLRHSSRTKDRKGVQYSMSDAGN
jgi:hypothetical protein